LLFWRDGYQPSPPPPPPPPPDEPLSLEPPLSLEELL
jgi:hypothetical protein